jgi:polyphosphate kinase
MKFLELTNAYNKKKIMINLNNIIRISEGRIFRGASKVPCTLIETVRAEDYSFVEESYETIKEIIEKGA